MAAIHTKRRGRVRPPTCAGRREVVGFGGHGEASCARSLIDRRAICTGYRCVIETIGSRHGPQRTAVQLARAVGAGRGISAALRHLDAHGSEPDGAIVADALARFLVARCESRHAGWRVIRQVVVDSAADAPWEKCARRAVPAVSEDLLRISAEDGPSGP
jgi:hypothetical protein